MVVGIYLLYASLKRMVQSTPRSAAVEEAKQELQKKYGSLHDFEQGIVSSLESGGVFSDEEAKGAGKKIRKLAEVVTESEILKGTPIDKAVRDVVNCVLDSMEADVEHVQNTCCKNHPRECRAAAKEMHAYLNHLKNRPAAVAGMRKALLENKGALLSWGKGHVVLHGMTAALLAVVVVAVYSNSGGIAAAAHRMKRLWNHPMGELLQTFVYGPSRLLGNLVNPFGGGSGTTTPQDLGLPPSAHVVDLDIPADEYADDLVEKLPELQVHEGGEIHRLLLLFLSPLALVHWMLRLHHFLPSVFLLQKMSARDWLVLVTELAVDASKAGGVAGVPVLLMLWLLWWIMIFATVSRMFGNSFTDAFSRGLTKTMGLLSRVSKSTVGFFGNALRAIGSEATQPRALGSWESLDKPIQNRAIYTRSADEVPSYHPVTAHYLELFKNPPTRPASD